MSTAELEQLLDQLRGGAPNGTAAVGLGNNTDRPHAITPSLLAKVLDDFNRRIGELEQPQPAVGSMRVNEYSDGYELMAPDGWVPCDSRGMALSQDQLKTLAENRLSDT